MYFNSGDNEEALAQARTSLAFNPDNTRATALMASIPEAPRQGALRSLH
jgi:hypothetical protein